MEPNGTKSYISVPTSPLQMAINLKCLTNIHHKHIDTVEIAAGVPVNYFQYLLDNQIRFAEGIIKFRNENNLSKEETIKVLRITEEQYNMYLELLYL